MFFLLKPEKYNKIDNKIKHNHARYCFIKYITKYKGIYGYYINGLTKHGIGPDIEIHPMYKGMYTCTSYNYDIKNLLVTFYIISEYAAKTVEKIILKYANKVVIYKKIDYKNNDNIKILIYDIISMDNMFFIDEYQKNIPQIELTNNILILRDRASYSFINKLYKPQLLKISAMGIWDDENKGLIMPYNRR